MVLIDSRINGTTIYSEIYNFIVFFITIINDVVCVLKNCFFFPIRVGNENLSAFMVHDIYYVHWALSDLLIYKTQQLLLLIP